MAGSYSHIVDQDNKFIGLDLIDNLGDAYEALEECYEIIQELSGGSKTKIFEAHKSCLLKKKGVDRELIKKETEKEYFNKCY